MPCENTVNPLLINLEACLQATFHVSTTDFDWLWVAFQLPVGAVSLFGSSPPPLLISKKTEDEEVTVTWTVQYLVSRGFFLAWLLAFTKSFASPVSLLGRKQTLVYATDKRCEWLRKRKKPCERETSAHRVTVKTTENCKLSNCMKCPWKHPKSIIFTCKVLDYEIRILNFQCSQAQHFWKSHFGVLKS